MKRILFGSSALLLAPAFVFAANTIGGIVTTLGSIISSATPIVVALALLYFFWGLAQYILAAGSEEKKAEGKNIMIWGIIALFVMVSVWGLVAVVQSTFNVQQTQSITPPKVNL